MTELLLLFLAVIVLGALTGWLRRARAGHRLVKSHHRALDALGQIATSRAGGDAPAPAADEERSHVKVVGAPALSRPTPPRVPRQLRAGRRPTRPSPRVPLAGERAAVATNGSTPAARHANDVDRADHPVEVHGAGHDGEVHEPRHDGDVHRRDHDGYVHPPDHNGVRPGLDATTTEPLAGLAADRLSLEARRDRSPWRRAARAEPAATNGNRAPEADGDRAQTSDGNGVRVTGEDGQAATLEAPADPQAARARRVRAASFEVPVARVQAPVPSESPSIEDRPPAPGESGQDGPRARAEEVTVSEDLTVFPAAAPPPGQRQPPVDDWVHKALGWTDDGIDDWWPERPDALASEEGDDTSEDPTLATVYGTNLEGDGGTGDGVAMSEPGEDLWSEADDVWTAPSADAEDGHVPPSSHGALRRSLERRSRNELVALGSAALVAAAVVVVILAARSPNAPSAHHTPPADAVHTSSNAHQPKAATTPKTTTPKTTPKTTTTTAVPPVKLVSSSPTEDVYQLQSSSASIVLTSTQAGRSWVIARQGDDSGDLAFEGLFQHGEQRTFTGPYWFDLGVPGSVRITVNGTPIRPPSVATRPVEVQFNAGKP